MKIKIKSFNGELPEYLTEGKEYRVCGRVNKDHLIIRCDDNQRTFIKINSCGHLNSGSWGGGE